MVFVPTAEHFVEFDQSGADLLELLDSCAWDASAAADALAVRHEISASGALATLELFLQELELRKILQQSV
jgi:hypothetical protein